MLDQENGLRGNLFQLKYVSFPFHYIIAYSLITIFSSAIIDNFSVTQINETAISFQWIPIDGAYSYTVYHSCSGSMTLGNGANYNEVLLNKINTVGLIVCIFTISININIKGTLYEGGQSSPVLQGN